MTAPHLPVAIEHILAAALIPYARNSRTHSVEQIDKVVASIREFGFTNPVLIRDDNTIVAGHGRVLAAQRLGLSHVPCIRLSHLTEAQARAYVIADNKLAELAGWDNEVLALEMRELQADNFDLDLIGFDADEISELIAAPGIEGETDADEVPAPAAEPISRAGDIWTLGRHRLMCGDSTDVIAVANLLNDAVPHLMVTDPPYGVEYDPTRTSDNPMKAGKVLNDDRADWQAAWQLFPGDVAYIWHASMFSHVVLSGLQAAGFEHRAMIVWAKDRFTLGRGHYHWQHEPCWYVVRGGGNRTLVWRSQSIDALVHKSKGRRRTRARHTKASRMHAPAHRKQQPPRRFGIRAIQWIGHNNRRRRADRTRVLRDGALGGLCRCGSAALAELYRRASQACCHGRALPHPACSSC